MSNDWFEEAIIYAVDVAKFADSNGDGVGDFRGLADRMPYLHELGVTCIWLLPCYPSARRDNGYDITNYYGIDTRLGTLDDFLHALHRAGEFGIQVIMDLVVSHTSNEHPWFLAARHDERSVFRDYYTWSGRPPPLPSDTKTIFPGEESSVWSYDEIARSYYFHRFYHFQPDLKVENPEVLAEIKRIMDFWLSFGISGFRLDAVAPMLASKGIEDPDLPRDPHGILRELFGYLQERRPGSAFLGEVDVEPEQFDRYFNGSTQLNMLLNFIMANYLFLGLARGEADAIIKGQNALPHMPPGGQWVNFLRNLDELDLERLQPDEREEVMRAFAPDPDMRIYNRGIRRRLAPMLKGDVRRLKMVFSLLFSLPGVPMFVYGDELGMGDDLSREGRTAVRAPMQWSAAANAGFSEAAEGDLLQQLVPDKDFPWRSLNVEKQRADADSLLNTVRTLIALRRRLDGISHSRWHPLDTGQPGVLGYGYHTDQGQLLMLHNLTAARHKATLAVDSGKAHCMDLLSEESAMAGERLQVTLEAYGYRWFKLTAEA